MSDDCSIDRYSSKTYASSEHSQFFTTAHNFRTVSLPGLYPATHLRLLVFGSLDKRRDGAVRGGWAKRLFILSTKSLHYYRKSEEFELFGKERRQTALQDIECAKLIPNEYAPSGAVESGIPSHFIALFSQRKTMLMLLRAETSEFATAWVNAINQAIMIAKCQKFNHEWPMEVIQNYIGVVTSGQNGTDANSKTLKEAKNQEQMELNLTVNVLAISMKSSTCEILIQRHIVPHSEVTLGAFLRDDVCIIVLSNGEGVRITRLMLDNDISSLCAQPKRLTLYTPARTDPNLINTVSYCKVNVSIRCTKNTTGFVSPRSPLTSSVQPTTTSASFTTAFPTLLGGLFILSCSLAFYCEMPFTGLMKMTAFLGFVQSISQAAQFVISTFSSSKARSQTGANNQLLQKQSDGEYTFHLQVEQLEMVQVDQSVADDSDFQDLTQNSEQTDRSSGKSIPFSPRFIAAEKGNEERGKERYLQTLSWRKENDVDQILRRPHRNFENIKKCYPQYFHGRSKAGNPVYYEKPGKIDLLVLKQLGLSIEDLIYHYMYITEFLWTYIEPDDAARSITVLDVSGIGMSSLGGEVLDFIKRASTFTAAHYPERSAHIFIINIPGWFNMIWRIVKPLIDPVTREKVHMLKGRGSILRELKQLIDIDQIPEEYGGQGAPLGMSAEENTLRSHVNKYLH
uniref:SEC14 cytosolic factor putative n=1 Tax=Albugo laibachii Nc14 TaxID=890382 RepID=F0WTS4_9STRA|nr:SEC14 cytosolic factor putative [Albugo laibachii Nc14]|eukprot:CCA24767.1 SEC14 cytosolic factor putative [Albugo laibachii Nc14]